MNDCLAACQAQASRSRGVGAGSRIARCGLALVTLGVMGALVAAADPGLPPAHTEAWKLPDPDLYAVSAVGDRVWAAGYWGALLHSADGGRVFEALDTPTDHNLFDISFADPSHGWAVGAFGTILRTENGGRDWVHQKTTVVDLFEGEIELRSHLFGVFALSANEAWVVGDLGVILHTTDGKTWTQVPVSEEFFIDDNVPDRIFNRVRFSDPQHGWISGEFGTTLRTADGGATWTSERTFEGAIEDLYLFDAAGDATGQLAVGVGGVVLGSDDGGATWRAFDVPTTAGLFGAGWRDGRGIVIGDRGVVLLTEDGGRTWTSPERPRAFNWLRDVQITPEGRVFIVGERGLVLRSDDGGRSFEIAAGHEPPPSAGISVPDPSSSQVPGRRNGTGGGE